jgi:hypothetical protein
VREFRGGSDRAPPDVLCQRRRFLLFSAINAPWEAEADMNTCPECNGDGVIEKGTDDEEQAQHAAAVVWYLMTTMTRTTKK